MSRLVPLPHHNRDGHFRRSGRARSNGWRRYSNYLTPHKGAFTGDTWAAVASLDPQCVGEPGATDLDLPCRALCAASVRPVCISSRTRLRQATNSSVVSSVTTGGAKTTLTLDLGPARPDANRRWPGHDPHGLLRGHFRGAMRCWEAIPSGSAHGSRWSRAAFLFFLLGGVSIGRFLRFEYSGSLLWKERELPDRRGTACGRVSPCGRWSGRMCWAWRLCCSSGSA